MYEVACRIGDYQTRDRLILADNHRQQTVGCSASRASNEGLRVGLHRFLKPPIGYDLCAAVQISHLQGVHINCQKEIRSEDHKNVPNQILILCMFFSTSSHFVWGA